MQPSSSDPETPKSSSPGTTEHLPFGSPFEAPFDAAAAAGQPPAFPAVDRAACGAADRSAGQLPAAAGNGSSAGSDTGSGRAGGGTPPGEQAPAAGLSPAETAASPGASRLPSIRTSHQHARSAESGVAAVPSTASGGLPGQPPAQPVWGWLQPGRPGLPHVLLQGRGVAIGRGREVYEERLPLLLLGSPSATPNGGGGGSGSGSRRHLTADGAAEALAASPRKSGLQLENMTAGRRHKAATFVEVPDGRVSRLHCWVKRGTEHAPPMLEDCSSNGTFLNGAKLDRGALAPLREGDRISLVLSVAPLAEQFFVYHGGDPRAQNPLAEWIEAATKAWSASPAGSPTGGSPTRRSAAQQASLARSKTSTYATAEATTLDDLQCQICLGTLRNCVALEPCGHNFCAACLSHHFAALLGGGQPLACPLRCSPPDRVIANWAVRRLVRGRAPGHGASQRRQQAQQGAGEGGLPGARAASWLGTLHEAGSGGGQSGPGSRVGSGELQPAAPGSAAAAAAAEGGRAPAAAATTAAAAQPGSSAAGAATAAAAAAAAAEREGPEGDSQVLRTMDEDDSYSDDSVASWPHAGWHERHGGLEQQEGQGPEAAQEEGEGEGPASGGPSSPSGPSGHSAWDQLAAAVEGEEGEEGEELGMNPLCPLFDDLLPLDAAGLKKKQLSYSVETLREAESASDAMAALEAIARLAWSDDAVRAEIADLGGVESVIGCLQKWAEEDGVQCNGCLALMALVRGEGDISDANKWRVARADGVEAIVGALRAHCDQPMVQLSALLCIMPLALENSYLQARIADIALPDILLAIRQHPTELEVVGKALVALGVLGQGDEPAHERIRDAIVAAGAPHVIARVLGTLGVISEEVLWAALFALAVVVRESSQRYVEHMLALAAAGVLPALRSAMAAYRLEAEQEGVEADEMILRAGDYLTDALGKAEELLWLRRKRKAYLLMALAATAVLAYRTMRRLRPTWQRRGRGLWRGGATK